MPAMKKMPSRHIENILHTCSTTHALFHTTLIQCCIPLFGGLLFPPLKNESWNFCLPVQTGAARQLFTYMSGPGDQLQLSAGNKCPAFHTKRLPGLGTFWWPPSSCQTEDICPLWQATCASPSAPESRPVSQDSLSTS